MRKKGFMFTMDSFACVVIAISIMLLVPTIPRIKASEKSQYIFMEKIARDESVVALYIKELKNDSIPQITSSYVCKKYFRLEPNTTTTQTNVSVYNKCFETTVVS